MAVTTKKVVVVGGGPAGAAAAIALAKRGGFSVELYESYAHPKRVTKNSPIAYVIALGSRGQQGIRNSTGIDPLTDIPDAIVSTCIVRHPSGTLMKHEDRPSLIVPRQVLTAYLLDQAVAAGVSVHFEKRLIDVDFENRTAVFEPSGTTAKEKRRTQATYDLLIGADGSNSCVRCLLESRKNDFVVRREKDSMEYQVVVVKSPFPDLPSKAVHAWNNKQYNAICLGFPLANDGAMLMAVVFPEGKLASFKSSGYKHALEALFPDLCQDDRSEIADQLQKGTIANGGLCVWVSALGNPENGVLLLGDSGHGMWPSLGQGANCALESAAVFTSCLSKLDLSSSNVDWAAELVRSFQEARHADALAAVDLTYGGIGARTSRGRQNSPLSYKLQIAGMMVLNKLTRGIIPKPALLRLMKGTADLSYSQARAWNFYYEKAICIGALVVTVSVPALLWSRRSKK